jgi:hypothetical protein
MPEFSIGPFRYPSVSMLVAGVAVPYLYGEYFFARMPGTAKVKTAGRISLLRDFD